MTQTRKKWNFLVLSRADFWMVWRCHGIPYFHFLFFCLEPTVKKNTWMRTISITVTWYQLCSKFFLNIYEVHWQRHLKDTLQLKILQQWINIRANSSLVNIMKPKLGEGARKTISITKVWAYFMKSISLIMVFFFFSEANLVFIFNLTLIE